MKTSMHSSRMGTARWLTGAVWWVGVGVCPGVGINEINAQRDFSATTAFRDCSHVTKFSPVFHF